jgi:hypothetical protein
MDSLLDFVASNSALLLAVVALLISLRANHTAQAAHALNQQKKDEDNKVRLYEKKQEILNELDTQNTRMATLSLITSQMILLFRDSPHLHETMQDEFDRLKSNLNSIQTLSARYEEHRRGAEAIGAGADVAMQDEILAGIRRLTIHLDKDIAHEQAQLDLLRAKAARQ